MVKFEVSDILRTVELIIDAVMIVVYYGSETFFSSNEGRNQFGKFVITGGFAFSYILLCLCIAFDLNKKYPYLVISYNVVWFAFYLVAGILVLGTWTQKLGYNKDMKFGGLCVGSLCIVNCWSLVLSSLFVSKYKKEKQETYYNS
ncbi:UNVERIFIED_CONTAM: hypothetical protein RMT77_012484 [Armadillidium vulgare]